MCKIFTIVFAGCQKIVKWYILILYKQILLGALHCYLIVSLDSANDASACNVPVKLYNIIFKQREIIYNIFKRYSNIKYQQNVLLVKMNICSNEYYSLNKFEFIWKHCNTMILP